MSTLRNPVLYPAELRGRSSTFYSLPKMISRFQMRRLLRSEEHTSELQSRPHLVCRLLLEKKKKKDGIAEIKSQQSDVATEAFTNYIDVGSCRAAVTCLTDINRVATSICGAHH